MAPFQFLFPTSLQTGNDLKSYLINLSANYMGSSIRAGLGNGKADPPGRLQSLALLCMVANSSHLVQNNSLQALNVITHISCL